MKKKKVPQRKKISVLPKSGEGTNLDNTQNEIKESKFFNKYEDLYPPIFLEKNSRRSGIYPSTSRGGSVRHGPRGGHHHT